MPRRVLFLCTGNSARSILGEALLRHLGGDAFEVFSAGVKPKGLNPFTLSVLAENSVDVSELRSKHVSEFEDDAFDYVITVCDDAAEQCPVFPGSPRRIHWSLADPAAVKGDESERIAAFRTTFAELNRRLEAFVADATTTGPDS